MKMEPAVDHQEVEYIDGEPENLGALEERKPSSGLAC